MHHAEVVVGEHHRVLLGMRVGGVDLGVPVEVHTLGRKREVHGLLVERIGDRGVDLAVHGKLDDLLDALEGGVSALGGHLADLELLYVGDEVKLVDIDGTRLKLRFFHGKDRVDYDLGMAHEALGLLEHLGVAHHDGAAAVVQCGVGKRLDGDLGAVAGRITHGDANDGTRVSHLADPPLAI